MEFTLTYRGRLRANGGVADKQVIRRRIHSQMHLLWQQVPLREHRQFLEEIRPAGDVSLIQRVGDFRLVPLVSERLHLVTELRITLLRPEPPGAIITQGGDIDNRLKTLLDALRMPKVVGEIPANDRPQQDEDPFFCLLEDDNLVTRLSVQTDRLLEPVEHASEVLLLIHVHTKRTLGTWGNIGLG